MSYVKFLTNKKEQMTFNFDTGMEKEGNYGKQYAYGVQWETDKDYLYATEALNALLQKLGGVKGRTLEIEKAQDPADLKRTHWVIYENGQVITPNQNNPAPKQEAPNKLVDTINALVREVKDLKQRVAGLETIAIANGDKDALELHQSENEEIPVVRFDKDPVENPKGDEVRIEDVPF